VISGYAIEHNMARAISQATAVETVFVSNGRGMASTLPATVSNELMAKPLSPSRDSASTVSLNLGADRYLASSLDLSSSATAPLQLVVLKSFDPAEESIRQIDRLVLLAGLLALLLGTVLKSSLLACAHSE
jgi:hypothetical protein